MKEWTGLEWNILWKAENCRGGGGGGVEEVECNIYSGVLTVSRLRDR